MKDARIRCDGLYQRGAHYLRFYADGVIIECSDNRPVEQVATLLTRDRESVYQARGTYRVEDRELTAFLERCPPRRSYGYMTLKIAGEIEGDTLKLRLDWDEPDVSDYGPPSGHTRPREPTGYVFVPLP